MKILKMRATFGTPSDVGLKMLGVRDEDIQRGILLWSENIKKYEDTPRAFPGVRELMDGLKAGGCRIGIATSKNAAELEHSRLLRARDFQTLIVKATDKGVVRLDGINLRDLARSDFRLHHRNDVRIDGELEFHRITPGADRASRSAVRGHAAVPPGSHGCPRR